MIGQMVLKRRQERSYHGLPVKDLKSGLQKYVRRGMLDKGLWCLVELDLFRRLEADAQIVTEYLQAMGRAAEDAARRAVVQKARALRTNLVNRLVVMVPEEISIASWWMPLVVEEQRQAWMAAREQEHSLRHLITIYKHLMQQPKIRLISDLKSVYLLPPDPVRPGQLADLRHMHRGLLSSLGLSSLLEASQLASENLLDACRVDLTPFLGDRDEDLRNIVNGILVHLKYKSDHAFYWLGRLIDRQRDKQGVAKLGGRKDNLRLVWQLLFAFARQHEALWGETPRTYPGSFHRLSDVLAVLKSWYDTMSHREKPIYLYHALLLVVRRDEIRWCSTPPVLDTTAEEAESLSRANLCGPSLQLDPFVLDMHTGRRGRNGLSEFARVGALVENEDRAFRNEDYRRVYVGLKERLDTYRARGGALAQQLGEVSNG